MTATDEAGYEPAYKLDNKWQAARERLELLEGIADPMTERHLDQVGVGAGWRCLEVGAGAGSVVRMMLDRVGPGGSVLAVDLEPTLLEGMSAPNLEVRKQDVVLEPPPEGQFDLIHTRAVLAHIPQRDQVLETLIAALRPGGVLLLEEMETDTMLTEVKGAFGDACHVIYPKMFALGASRDWAVTLPDRLTAAGLVDVECDRERCMVAGGTPAARFIELSFDQITGFVPMSDAETAVLEAARVELRQPGGEFHMWNTVTAWGRKP